MYMYVYKYIYQTIHAMAIFRLKNLGLAFLTLLYPKGVLILKSASIVA